MVVIYGSDSKACILEQLFIVPLGDSVIFFFFPEVLREIMAHDTSSMSILSCSLGCQCLSQGEFWSFSNLKISLAFN